MKISEISAYAEYEKAEEEIRAWVEESYPGLSIAFLPHLEIVQTDESRRFTKPRVRKIVEAVNAKIDEILELSAEEIYLAERVERIRTAHPEYDGEIAKISALKTDARFLRYLKDLNAKGRKDGRV